MSADERKAREEMKDRFLEIALVEVLAEKPGNEYTFAHARRAAWWPPAVAAAGLLILALVVFRGSSDELDPIEGGAVDGVVVTSTGEPVIGATVRLEIGWISHGFEPTRRWASTSRARAATDDMGRFRIEGIPDGAVGMVFVRGPGQYAKRPAERRMEIVVHPRGSVEGSISAAHSILGDATVSCRMDGWPETDRVGPDPDGRFRLDDLPPGRGILIVHRGRWTAAVVPIAVSPEETAFVAPIRVEEGHAVSPDPLVRADGVQVIDRHGLPMFGVEVYWSRPVWAGKTITGSDGVGKFLSGGKRFTGVPVLLNLRSVGAWEGGAGRLLAVEDGVAVVEIRPRRTIFGRVPAAGNEYALFYEAGEESPRLYTGYVKDGDFTISVPTGRGALLVLTTDGRLHRTEIDLVPADEPLELEIEFGS
jgi:hypothetical protein